jgi:subtilisin family serine protease
MPDPLGKLDHTLRQIYTGFMKSQQASSTTEAPRDAGLPPRYILTLRYEGSLSEIESQGFTATWKEYEGLAHGALHLADLVRVASHPGVISLEYGTPHEPSLDTSAPEIKARASSTSNAGTDGVWFVDPSTGILSTTSLASGTGVIVGVIDTGIDIFHPVFMNSLSPFDTRILNIWDQGLDPAPGTGEKGPDVSLIYDANTTNAHTYGVEFDRQSINDYLNKVNPRTFRHRDCVGHGTHTAATAAGNGNPGAQPPALPFAPGGFEFVGIAPKADIVVVKFLDVKNDVRDTGGNSVSENVRMANAVRYIVNVAKRANKPAVLNCSFGTYVNAHDGLSVNEMFLDSEFGPDSSFRKGNIAVYAAGNSGGARTHAEVTIPASGTITVPFELYDDRGARTKKFAQCVWADNTPALLIRAWYREPNQPGQISVAVKAPTETAFTPVAFNSQVGKPFDTNKKWTLTHTGEPAVKRPVPGSTPVDVQRNSISLLIEPNSKVDPAQHKTGVYELRINGPKDTVLHAWTRQVTRRFGVRVGPSSLLTADADTGAGTFPDGLHLVNAAFLAVGDTITIKLKDGNLYTATIASSTGGSPGAITIAAGLPSPAVIGAEVVKVLSPAIDVNDRNLIDSEAGAKYVIAVAAYDDLNGKTGEPGHDNIAVYSSRGPLVDYSGLGPYAVKPDIAAPGTDIKAAQSRFKDSTLANGNPLGLLFIELSGTSMSAPHVSGAIALMLEKNRNLTVDDVRLIFATAANDRDGTGPTPADGSEYHFAYGGGMLDAQGAHGAVH